MYCNNCGAKMSKKIKYCEQCGAPVDNSEIITEKGNGTKKRILVAIISIVLLFTVGIVGLSQTGILNPIEHNLKLGYKYLEEGKYEEAVLAFDKVIAIDENNTRAVLGTADAYVGLDRFDDAVELLTLHIAADSAKTQLYDKLIRLYIEKGNYAAAKETIDEAAEYGYEFDLDLLDDTIKTEIMRASGVLTGFQSGGPIVETNSKVVIVDSKGVKIRKSDSEDERIVLTGEYGSSFVTDGTITYLYDVKNKRIEKLNMDTGHTEKIKDIEDNVPENEKSGFFPTYQS